MRNKLQQISLVVASMLPFLFLQPLNAWSEDKPTKSCEAEPQKQGQQSQNDSSSAKDTLADCKGVLDPPAVGDPELVKPAPDVGKMPVIPPGSVPQNEGNGQGNAK